MTTKNFIMEIPIALHDIVQDFIISALAVRPTSYVDYAVEYYLHLQAKGSRHACDNFRVRSEEESPGADSEEICIDGEVVSDTANIFQVSINPEAFQSPDLKHYPSEDDPIDGDSIVELPSSDQAVPTDSEIKLSDTSVTILNRSLMNLKTESNLLQLNTSTITSPSQVLPPSNPFTLSLQGNSFTVPPNSVSILPVTPSHTVNVPTNMPAHNNSITVSASNPLTAPNNRPATPLQYAAYPAPSVNGFSNCENSLHNSSFTTPYKNGHHSQALAAELMHSHPGHQRSHPNNYQCKSCKEIFKPHPRPLTQPFYSLPSTPEGSRPLLPSSHDTPDRTSVHSLLHPSHFSNSDMISNSGSPHAFFTANRTPNNKVDPSERKFPCPICEKSYKSNTGLKRHLIVHTGERPYQCQYCFKSFYRKYVLTTHISRVHAKQIAAAHS